METLGAGEHADATATEGVDYEGVSQDFAVTEPDFGTDSSIIVSIDVPVIHDHVGESDEWFLIRVTVLPSTTFAFRGETPRLDSLTLAHASQYLTVKHVDNAPGAPEGLVAWPGDEEAVLRWTAGPDGGSAITGYQYRRSDDDGDHWSPDWADIEGSGAETTSHTVEALANGTAYTFEVRALNAEGEGLASNRARAVPLALPGAPTDLAASAGPGAAVLRWTAPASDGGSAITGYRYRQSTDGGRNWRPDWTDIADSAPGGDRAAGYPVEGLVSGPEYGFEVRAVNAEGAGPPSNRARVTLPVTPVSAPGREVWSATLTVAGNGLDRHGYFHQDRMGIPGGALSDRSFAYNGLHHGVGVTSVPGGGDRDVEIGTLEFILDQPLAASVANNANLSLHVGAREFRFDEVLSTPPVYSWRDHVPSRVPSWIVGQTVALSLRDHAPSAPGGLAVEPGDGEVGLAWTVPASDGGSDLTGFQYRQSDDGGDDWSPDWTDTGSATTTAITVDGLDNGTAYTFEVRAVNARSAGAASNRASATPFGLPGAPTGLAVSSGHGYAVLAWAAPDSDGGSAITGFQYRQSDDGGDNWEPDWADIAGSPTIILSATSTPLTVDGLDNGTTYTFEVRAVNAAGESAASNQASATPAAGTGARMTLAVVTCQIYARRGCIHHDRIAEDAGTVTVPVQIDIPQSWAASGYWADPVDKATGQLDIRVETLGAGEHADATATEGVDYEGVSQDFAVTEPDFGTDSNIIVSIDVPVIHDHVGESDEWFLIRVTVLPSTTFAFRGETPRLDSLTLAHASQYLTVKHVDNAPGAPEGLVAWPGDEEAVLRWTAGPDGGSGITGYQYRRSDDAGDNWSPDWTDIDGSGAGTTSHAVGGLDNGMAYTFEVRAVNAEGEGLASNRARAVPLVVALAFEAAEADTAEGAGTVTVCMALDAPAARDAMVRFRTVGDTARDGSDYGGRDLVLTIAPGDARICQSIAIVDDAEGEAEEYFEVVLSELSGGIELGDPSTVRVRIGDDDGTIPAAPAELSATPGNGEVTLRWTTPASDGGSPITTFRYRQSTDGGGNWSPDWTAIPDCTPDTVEHTVGGLANGTYYTFEVQAVNMLGRGPPSNRASAAPSVAPPIDASVYQCLRDAGPACIDPGNIAEDIGTVTVPVRFEFPAAWTDDARWGDPDAENGRLDVRVETLGAGEHGDATATEGADYTGVSQDFAVRRPYLDTSRSFVRSIEVPILHDGLGEADERFYIRVTFLPTSTFTFRGRSPGLSTVTLTARPLVIRQVDTAPSAPRDLVAQAGTGEATLRWRAPAADGGGAITGYRYRQSDDGGGHWSPDWTDIEDSAPGGDHAAGYPVEELDSGTEYTFEVQAVNAEGAGPASNRASATPRGPPGAPGSLVARAGDGQVALGWTAPASDGGSEITGYRVRRKAGSGGFGDWTEGGNATTTALAVTGLANGTAYTFEVRAVNAAGEGAASNQASATPVAGTGARMVFSVVTCQIFARRGCIHHDRIAEDAGTVTVPVQIDIPQSWAASGYWADPVDKATGQLDLRVETLGAGEHADATATEGADYEGVSRDFALTEVDFGTASAITRSIDVPVIHDRVGEGDERFVIRVTVLASSTFTFRGETPRLDSLTLAHASQYLTVKHVDNTPGAPRGLVAEAGNGEVVLSWTAGPDGGSAITGHQYRQSTDGGDHWSPDWTGIEGSAPGGDHATGYPVRGLAGGATYTFEVRAVNAEGEGLASNRASAMPGDPPMRSAVRTCEAHVGSPCVQHANIAENAGTVGVPILVEVPPRWFADPAWGTAGGGASGQVDFRVETLGAGEHAEATATEGADYAGVSQVFSVAAASLDATGAVVRTVNVPLVHDRVAEPDEGFLVRVTFLASSTLAFQGETAGLPTHTHAGSAQRLTIRHADNGPGAPTDLAAQPDYDRVTLSWVAPAQNGGSRVTGFEYRQSTDDGGHWIPDWAAIAGSGPDTARHTVHDLVGGTEYTFEVRAVNGVGPGPASARVKATAHERGPVSVEPHAVAEGERAALVLAPAGAPFAADRTLTVVFANRGGADAPEHEAAGPGDWTVAGIAGTALPRRAQPGLVSWSDGPWPYLEVVLVAGATEVTVALAAVDDEEVERDERVHVLGLDGGQALNDRSVTFTIEGGDLYPEIRHAVVDGATIALTFSRELQLVEDPDDTPLPAENYFLRYTGPNPPTWGYPRSLPWPAPGQPRGQGPEAFRLSARTVTLTFDEPVAAGETVWVAYRRFSMFAPLGDSVIPRERGGGARDFLRRVDNLTGAGPPAMGVADAEGFEAEGASLEFTVTLDGPSAQEVMVAWTTVDGTATAGEDYTRASGTLSFAPGETSRTVAVALLDDAVEDDGETLRLVLSDVSGAVLADGEATGTIRNHEGAPGGIAPVEAGDGTRVATLSVADARVEEAANAVLAFRLILDRAAPGTVRVDYATADGTAVAGADYTAASGTQTFRAGETEKTVEVAVLDDAHHEGEETLTLALTNPVGARLGDASATGTIVNSDPIPKAWLARFGRQVAGHVVDAVEARLSGRGGAGSHVVLGGRRVSPAGGGDGAGGADEGAWTRREAPGRAGEGRGRADGSGDGSGDESGDESGDGTGAMTGRELLLGSSFLLTGAGTGTAWAAWGRAAASRFDGVADGLTVDGDVTSLVLGADLAREGWMAGVALSRSEGTGSFRDHAPATGGPDHPDHPDHPDRGSGALRSTLTAVHPYARLDVSERLTVWGVLGYGAGELGLTVDATATAPEERWTTATRMRMAAAGARGVLVPAAAAGGLEIAARTDAQLVRMASEAATGSGGGRLAASEARTSRLRLVLEGSHRIGVGAGGTLTPGLEIGLRHDGGDAETGTGLEIGGSLEYRDPASGLGVDVRARSLVAHEDAHYVEWGGSASLSWDADPSSDRGLSLSLARSRGAAAGGAERLWSLEDVRGLAPEKGMPAPGRLEAELGYGFPVFDHRGLAIPHARWSRSDTAGTLVLGQRLRLGSATEWNLEGEFGEEYRTFRAGYGYRPGSPLDLGVEASRREAASGGGAAGHEITLRARLRW